MTGIIYKWTNNINGKCYVGQTTNPKKRHYQHKRGERADKQMIDRAILKYGVDSFYYEEVESIVAGSYEELKEKLNERERHYINLYQSYISQNGYNMTLGGQSNGYYQHTKETKEKLSMLKKGVKLSKEVRENISKGHKGLILSDEHKRKLKMSHSKDQVQVVQLSDSGVEIARYESIKDASRATGINRGGISACINNKQQTTTGLDGKLYRWRKILP